MSVEVNEPFELIFKTDPGSTVTMSWYDPMEVAVIDDQAVTEDAANPGNYPILLTPTSAGSWRATFNSSGTLNKNETFWERAVVTTAQPPLAAVSDVREQRQSLTDAQAALAATLLRMASQLVRQEYPYVDDQIAKGTLDPNVVALAVVNMTIRVLRNPDGLRAQSTGPFSRAYDTGKVAGLLYIDDMERTMLTPAPTTFSGVGTIMAKPGLAPAPWGARPWMDGRRGRNWSIG